MLSDELRRFIAVDNLEAVEVGELIHEVPGQAHFRQGNPSRPEELTLRAGAKRHFRKVSWTFHPSRMTCGAPHQRQLVQLMSSAVRRHRCGRVELRVPQVQILEAGAVDRQQRPWREGQGLLSTV